MRWIFLTIVVLLVITFLTYVISKMQMLGWLNAIKAHLEYQEKIKEEKTNVKEEKTQSK